MTIVLLPLIAVGAVVAWAAGVRPPNVLWGVLAACVLLLVSSLAVAGVLVFTDDDDDGPGSQALRSIDEHVQLSVADGDFDAPVRPIDGLSDGEVRFVEIEGLSRRDTAFVRECRSDGRCGPALPVQADRDGRARFLFDFRARVAPGPDCLRLPCSMVVTGDSDGERLASIPLAFGTTVGHAAITADRVSQLDPDDRIAVTLAGFTPGRVTVTWCTPPGPADGSACGTPAPEVTATVAADGSASVELPVHDGRVGTDGSRCGRGHPCAIAVAGRPDVAVVRVAFAGSADARPAAVQVAVGLAVAAALFALAFIGMRRGPWTPPDGDPFAGIVLGDPFADLGPDPDDPWDEIAQPATSRRENETAPAATITRT